MYRSVGEVGEAMGWFKGKLRRLEESFTTEAM